MGRYNNSGSGGDVSLRWIGLWIVWLVIFLIVLPPVMGCSDVSCTTQDPNNLLVLWLDVLTLFGTVTYLQFIFGVWAFLLVIGTLDMMSQ